MKNHSLVLAVSLLSFLSSANAEDKCGWLSLPTVKVAVKELSAVKKADRIGAAWERCRSSQSMNSTLEPGLWCTLAFMELPVNSDKPPHPLQIDITLAAAWIESFEGFRCGYSAVRTMNKLYEPPALFKYTDVQQVNLREGVIATGATSYSRQDDVLVDIGLRQYVKDVGVSLTYQAPRNAKRLAVVTAFAGRELSRTDVWAIATALNLRFNYEDKPSAEQQKNDDRELLEAARKLRLPSATDKRDATALFAIESARANLLTNVDSVAGSQLGEELTRSCASRLWPTAEVCRTRSFKAANESAQVEWRQNNPRQNGETMPETIGYKSNFYSDGPSMRCRAVYGFDIDDNGVMKIQKEIYSDPPAVCKPIAEQYFAQRLYKPKSPDRPKEIRQGLVVSFEQDSW